MKIAAAVVATLWAMFQIYIWWYKGLDLIFIRSAHLSFAMATGALLVAAQSGPRARWAWVAVAVLAVVPPIYHFVYSERWLMRIAGLDPVLWQDYAIAVLLGLLLAALGWKLVGRGMVLVVGFFVAYQMLGAFIPGPLGHRQGGIEGLIDQQIMTMEGVFGIPLGISVTVVFYFILFAAVFEAFGGGKMIVDLALAMTGRYRGGPAKAAVVGSALTGLVSGSAVANVMSSGIFSIPLMKRAGYKPQFAAAVEAVVSTGGQFVPPVMGAAAFIMADMLRIPYSQIIGAAAIPAFLYFASVFITVDFKARRDALPLLPRDAVAPIKAVLKSHGHMLIPLVWLAYQIVQGRSVALACVQGIVATIVIGSLHPATRQKPMDILKSFSTGAQRAVTVAIPCAMAGVIVGVVAYTGLGTKFTGMIVDISMGSVVLAVALTILATVVLGFGMPTTSAYVMSAILLAPALVRIGFEPLAAHMMLLYFAVFAMVTPPIALASYAAAGIAETSASKTGWNAMALALPLMLIPVMFLYRSELLLQGPLENIVWSVPLTFAMLVAAAAAVTGWLLAPLSPVARSVAAAAAVCLALPNADYPIWVLGAASLASLAAYGWRRRMRATSVPALHMEGVRAEE